MPIIDKESYNKAKSLKSMIKLMYGKYEWFQGCSANLKEETISIFHSEMPEGVSNLLPSTVNGFSIVLKYTGNIEAYEYDYSLGLIVDEEDLTNLQVGEDP